MGQSSALADAEAGLASGGSAVPRHVAIIMDGNGRWAKERGLPRTEGHRRGLEAVRRAVSLAGERGIRFLTIFSFSSENWTRPPEEVSFLMGLLKMYIRSDLAELHGQNVRVRVIGSRRELQPDILRLLEEAERTTAGNTGLTLVVAFNYGARQDLVEAVRAIAGKARGGAIQPADVDERMLSAALMTDGIPDPDLLIRTSGEQRLSNFLLWQCAYTEFIFLPVLWPDFDREHFDAALTEFSRRQRRFGGLAAKAG